GGGTDVSDDTTWRDEHSVTQRAIDIRLRLRTEPRALVVELIAANRSSETVALDVAWRLDADFADIQEAFAADRQQTASVDRDVDGDSLVIRYRHSRLMLATRCDAFGAAWRASAEGLDARAELAPRAVHTSSLRVVAVDPGAASDDAVARMRKRARAW